MSFRKIANLALGASLAFMVLGLSPAFAQVTRPEVQSAPPTGSGPAPEEWGALAELPDWTGIWVNDWIDQNRQRDLNDVPWNAETAAEVERQIEFSNQDPL